ncbi:hypothetical protein PFLG_01865 [Plasmodium falciparum RAJ116]|uniref:Uncharacterized protein n=1 Tax=Plasmodium falciparum RAJ116 TaxID=580058 RepID=A0A0L0CY81_PLAFA|nr:hypothetical protein PFLG_01865 [Plasmodium falciparum RAJ116]
MKSVAKNTQKLSAQKNSLVNDKHHTYHEKLITNIYQFTGGQSQKSCNIKNQNVKEEKINNTQISYINNTAYNDYTNLPNVETYVLSEKSNNLENKEDNNINEKFKNDNNVDKKNNDENNIIKHNVNQNNNEVIVMNNQTEEQINDNKFIKPLNNITGIDPKKKNIYNTVMHINDKMDLK